MSERRIVQLPLGKMDMSMLLTFASIGAAFVDQCEELARGDMEATAAAANASVSMAQVALRRFERGDYTWEAWKAITDRAEALQHVAFPEAPPHRVGGSPG